MSNSARGVFRGVRQLVRDHRREVWRTHGVRYVLLWYLRIGRAFVRYQIAVADTSIGRDVTLQGPIERRCLPLLRAHRSALARLDEALGVYFRKHFVHDLF